MTAQSAKGAKPAPKVLLIGSGAIGSEIQNYYASHGGVEFAWVLDLPDRVPALQQKLGQSGRAIGALNELDGRPDFVVECAGHAAVKAHVPDVLRRGIDVILVSTGSLATGDLAIQLEQAAIAGGARLTLISGAIAAIDALAAAKIGGLDDVTYVGRKPPTGWKGTAAEKRVDLASLTEPVTFFEGTAREAATLYPQNANVAATVALAGLGLDNTRATLIADPGVSRNIHRVNARGTFGEFELTIAGKAMANNPKTSALTAFSAIRAINNRIAALIV